MEFYENKPPENIGANVEEWVRIFDKKYFRSICNRGGVEHQSQFRKGLSDVVCHKSNPKLLI